MNVLEIRNLGSSPLEFKQFALEHFPKRALFSSLDESNPLKHKSRSLPSTALRIAERVAKLANGNQRLMEKAARGLPFKLIKYVADGGEWFPFAKFAYAKGRRGYCFFDPFTRKPTAPWRALPSIAPLFEGNALDWHSLPVTLTPAEGVKALSAVAVAAVANSADSLTIALAAWPSDVGKSVEVLIPCILGMKRNTRTVSSQNNRTGARSVEKDKSSSRKIKCRMKIASGILPIKKDASNDRITASGWVSPQFVKESDVTIFDGVFKKSVILRDLTVIRLIKADSETWSRIEIAPSKSGFLPGRLRVLPPSPNARETQ